MPPPPSSHCRHDRLNFPTHQSSAFSVCVQPLQILAFLNRGSRYPASAASHFPASSEGCSSSFLLPFLLLFLLGMQQCSFPACLPATHS